MPAGQFESNRYIYLHFTLCFLIYGREFVLLFSVAGKFCLAIGLILLTRDTKSDVSCLQTLLTCRNEDIQITFGVGRHTTSIVNSLFKTSIFQRTGKINNQSSVSDADRENPTLGSTDNAGNSVNLVSGIIRIPSGWDFSVCIGDQ